MDFYSIPLAEILIGGIVVVLVLMFIFGLRAVSKWRMRMDACNKSIEKLGDKMSSISTILDDKLDKLEKPEVIIQQVPVPVEVPVERADSTIRQAASASDLQSEDVYAKASEPITAEAELGSDFNDSDIEFGQDEISFDDMDVFGDYTQEIPDLETEGLLDDYEDVEIKDFSDLMDIDDSNVEELFLETVTDDMPQVQMEQTEPIIPDASRKAARRDTMELHTIAPQSQQIVQSNPRPQQIVQPNPQSQKAMQQPQQMVQPNPQTQKAMQQPQQQQPQQPQQQPQQMMQPQQMTQQSAPQQMTQQMTQQPAEPAPQVQPMERSVQKQSPQPQQAAQQAVPAFAEIPPQPEETRPRLRKVPSHKHLRVVEKAKPETAPASYEQPQYEQTQYEQPQYEQTQPVQQPVSQVQPKQAPQPVYEEPQMTYVQPQQAAQQIQQVAQQIQQPQFNAAPQPVYEEPEAAYIQPQTAHIQPEAEYIQLQTAHIHPEAEYIQPQTVYAQPQAAYEPPREVYEEPVNEGPSYEYESPFKKHQGYDVGRSGKKYTMSELETLIRE